MQKNLTSGNWRLGLGLSLLSTFLWGTFPIILKVTVTAIDVYTITWTRFLGSFIFLGVYLLITDQFPRKEWRTIPLILLGSACVFLMGNYLIFLIGLQRTSPSNAQLFFQSSTLFLGLGSLVIFGEKYNRFQWIGLGILLTGFLLFFQEQLQDLIYSQNTSLIGNLLIVISAASWTGYALAQKQLLKSLSSTMIMLVIYGICAILLIPIAQPLSLFSLDWLHGISLLLCILNTVIAYGAFSEAMIHWESSKISAILAINPIITMSISSLLSLGIPQVFSPEKFGYLALFGAFLVVSGSVIISLSKTAKVPQ